MAYHPFNAQCFVKRSFNPVFEGNNIPQFLYACKIEPDINNSYSRVLHAHEDLVEIQLIFCGFGQYLIDNRIRNVKKGDLLVYNAGVVHDERAYSKSNLGFYCIAVGGLHMPGLRKNAFVSEGQDCCYESGDYFEELCTLFEMMYQTLSQGEPDAECFCDSLMKALLYRVLTVTRQGISEEREEAASSLEPDILGQQIKQYIDCHYMEPLSIEAIGKALHMSSWYVSHVFKEAIGYSPIQYLLRRRIGEAQTLLISTDKPITEIAFQVGFESQSYFNMQFTKNVGMPPLQFRKNYLVKEKTEDLR